MVLGGMTTPCVEFATLLHGAVDRAKLVVASVAVFVARGLAFVGVVIASSVCPLTRRCSGPDHATVLVVRSVPVCGRSTELMR